MTFTTVGYAILGGLLPSFAWLYFLLKEDARCPEPRAMVALAFVAGMAAVPLALPLEEFANAHLVQGIRVITAWATIEEVLKYSMAAAFLFWRPVVDEAPDYVIYMLTVALGFAAAENMLFLFTPLASGRFVSGLFTDDLRFLGSTLLHVVASSAIGFSLAFSASARPGVRTVAASLGLILAIALHVAFNTLIMANGGSTALVAFFLVWTVAIGFFATFEILKYFRYRDLPANTC